MDLELNSMAMKTTVATVICTAALGFWVSLDEPEHSMMSETTVETTSSLDQLIERYETGYFAERREIRAVTITENIDDTEVIRLRSQLIDLQVENDQLRHRLETQDKDYDYIHYLIETQRHLVLVRENIDSRNQQIARQQIDHMLTFTESELRRHGISSPLDELLIRQQRGLRDEEINRE